MLDRMFAFTLIQSACQGELEADVSVAKTRAKVSYTQAQATVSYPCIQGKIKKEDLEAAMNGISLEGNIEC